MKKKLKIIAENIFTTTCGVVLLTTTLVLIVCIVLFINSDNEIINALRISLCICEGIIISQLIQNIRIDIRHYRIGEDKDEYKEKEQND